MKDYLEWKKSTLEPCSYHNYERWVTRFLKFLKKPISELKLEDIGLFKQYLKSIPYSPRNIQYGLSIIRDFIGYEVAIHNLAFPLKFFKIHTERSNSHYAITESEYYVMLATFMPTSPRKVQRRLMLQMLWDTGMRGGELLRMRISDIKDLREAIIENEKNKRNRLVAWSAETTWLLKLYLTMREEIHCTEDYLFVSFSLKNPTKMNMRTLQLIIKTATRQLDNKISPHSFRHGFVHRHVKDGKPITMIAQMLGHSTPLNVHAYAQMSGLETRMAWNLPV